MNIKSALHLGIMMAWLELAASVAGAEFSVTWSTVDGGGAVSQSEDQRWLLAGTTGQADAAGPATGGDYTLEGGFWNSVLCAYGLRISHFRDDTTAERPVYTVVTWPQSGQGECVLEATAELHADPAFNVWTPVPFGVLGDQFAYVAPAGGPMRFFRLRSGAPAVP